jgi:hypothetical protein
VSNRWFRFVIAIVAIVAAGAAGYRVFQYEQQLAASAIAERNVRRAANAAVVTVGDLRSALHAYVAVGQGHDFWFARSTMLFNSLRASIVEMQRSRPGDQAALGEALDSVDRLAAAEKRARGYIDNGQLLLAGEVIFTDARDQLDALRLALVRAADARPAEMAAAQAQLERDQVMLALGAAGVLAFAVLVLVPPGRPEPIVVPEPVQAPPAPGPDGYRVVSRVPEQPERRKTSTPAEFPAPNVPVRAAASTTRPETSQPREARAATVPSPPSVPLADAASVCTDLGRVSQGNEISALLARAAGVLTATGVIVWVATENRDELIPAAFSGYDDRLLSKVGAIRRDASNLTAAAFRDGAARVSTRAAGGAAALAVPMLTPQGSMGVLSAEIRDVAHVDSDRLAVATIFAAQLASLLGAISVPDEVVSEPQVRNG